MPPLEQVKQAQPAPKPEIDAVPASEIVKSEIDAMPASEIVRKFYTREFRGLPVDERLRRLRASRDCIRQILDLQLAQGLYTPAAIAQRSARSVELREAQRKINFMISVAEAVQASLPASSPRPRLIQAIKPTPTKSTTPPPRAKPAESFVAQFQRLSISNVVHPPTTSADNPEEALRAAAKNAAPKPAKSDATSKSDGTSACNSACNPAPEVQETLLSAGDGDDGSFEEIGMLGEDFEYLHGADECEGFNDCGGDYDAITEKYDSFRPKKGKKSSEDNKASEDEKPSEDKKSAGDKDNDKNGDKKPASQQGYASCAVRRVWSALVG